MECQNRNTFRFQTESLCSVLDLVRTENNAEIRTICGFWTENIVWNPNDAVRTFGFRHYWHSYVMNAEIWTIEWTERSNEPKERMNRTIRNLNKSVWTIDRSDFSIVWISDVRISAFHCTVNVRKPNVWNWESAEIGILRVSQFQTQSQNLNVYNPNFFGPKS